MMKRALSRQLLASVVLFCAVMLLFLPAFAEQKEKVRKDRGVRIMANSGDSRKRVALVIGNGTYAISPLRNPVNDANAMAATLRKLGFEVEEKTNLGYVAMNRAVESFGKHLASGGVGLFYYAGHGVQVGGANYLLPVDAGLVLAKMEQAKSDVNIVVLDACRNNPFAARGFRSAVRGLASMDAPSGSLIAYATAPGKTAADGSGGNGIYTGELIRTMEIPGLSVEDVFKRVRRAVMTRTAKDQVPWESSSLTGDFHFVPTSEMTDAQPSDFRPQSPVPFETSPDPATRPGNGSAVGLTFRDPVTDMEFVNVPGGCYEMGDTFGDGWAPVHEVCVSDFFLGKYEVSQGQWQVVMGSNPSYFKECGPDCPVEEVSWSDARKFIDKLNSRSGKRYRLPTEAEWEYAAREGGRKVRFGNGKDILSADSANFDASAKYKKDYSEAGEYREKTVKVGSFAPNALGLYDMAGNVWEWCNDWYDGDYYGKSPRDNPQGPSSGQQYRVLRGGSWGLEPVYVRAASRLRAEPSIRSHNYGFRLAVSSQD